MKVPIDLLLIEIIEVTVFLFLGRTLYQVTPSSPVFDAIRDRQGSGHVLLSSGSRLFFLFVPVRGSRSPVTSRSMPRYILTCFGLMLRCSMLALLVSVKPLNQNTNEAARAMMIFFPPHHCRLRLTITPTTSTSTVTTTSTSTSNIVPNWD